MFEYILWKHTEQLNQIRNQYTKIHLNMSMRANNDF